MLAGEETRVLQSTVGPDEGQLSSTEDGIGFEACPLQKGLGVEVAHLVAVMNGEHVWQLDVLPTVKST